MHKRWLFARHLFFRRRAVIPEIIAALGVYDLVAGQAPEEWPVPHLGDVIEGLPFGALLIVGLFLLVVVSVEGGFQATRDQREQTATVEAERDSARARLSHDRDRRPTLTARLRHPKEPILLNADDPQRWWVWRVEIGNGGPGQADGVSVYITECDGNLESIQVNSERGEPPLLLPHRLSITGDAGAIRGSIAPNGAPLLFDVACIPEPLQGLDYVRLFTQYGHSVKTFSMGSANLGLMVESSGLLPLRFYEAIVQPH